MSRFSSVVRCQSVLAILSEYCVLTNKSDYLIAKRKASEQQSHPSTQAGARPLEPRLEQ